MTQPSLFLHLCLLSTGVPSVLAEAQSPASPAPATRWQGQVSGEAEPGARVVTEAGDWARLWRALGRDAPPLDFSRWCAVVAFAGERPTGGFRLVFEEPVQEGADLVIRWRVLPPGPDQIVTQALAHPWRVQAYPRPAGRVRLEPVLPESR